MKKLITFIKIVILSVLVFFTVRYCDNQVKPDEVPNEDNGNDTICYPSTLTKVFNATKDTVLVYVTLGSTPGCLQNVMEVSWVTDSVPGQRQLQGTFKLAPNDSTESYAPLALGFNGVISFNGQPSNCPDTTQYPTGINQYEFMINNTFQGVDAQESINISCVHGVNCVISVNIKTSNKFNAGPTVPVIDDFRNTMDRNGIMAGVYPFGCDTCTGSKTKLPCITYPQPAHKNSDCQIQRNAILSGGTINVIYMGQVNILK